MRTEIFKPAVFIQIVLLCFCSCNEEEVNVAPIIEFITPLGARPGDQVLINGQNFSEFPADNIVMFSDKRAFVNVASSTELLVTVPENFVSGKITIQIGDKSATYNEEFSVYPIIQNFLPKSGAIGDTIRIEGRSFSEELDQNKIMFGEQQAEVIKLTKGFETSFLYVTLPEDAATGTIDALIGDKQAVSTDTFKVLKFEIISIEPNEGYVSQEVIVSGSAFNPNTEKNKVYFNEVEAQVNYGDESSLSVTVPAGATTGKIRVSTKGRTVESIENFAVVEAVATINSFYPESGVPGSQLYIYGIGFSAIIEENVVKIGDINAIVLSSTFTELLVEVPENAITGILSVTVNNNTSNSSYDFIVLDQLTIQGFSPESSTIGSEVIIMGTGFSPNPASNAVYFNGVQAAVNFSSETEIGVIVPDGATTGKISVEVNGNSVTTETDFVIDE